MAILGRAPEHPVISASPTLGQAVKNFNLADWAAFFGLGLIGFPVGYFIPGQPRVVMRPAAYFAASMGFTAGFMYAVSSSSARLMGYRPNPAEVAKYKYRLDSIKPKTVPVRQ